MQSETAPLFASVGFAALFGYFAGKTSAELWGEVNHQSTKKSCLNLLKMKQLFLFFKTPLRLD